MFTQYICEAGESIPKKKKTTKTTTTTKHTHREKGGGEAQKKKKTNHELSPRESVAQGVHESRSAQLLHHPCITVAV
jgi:hypothetical protein